jgi:hypothetical protein
LHGLHKRAPDALSAMAVQDADVMQITLSVLIEERVGVALFDLVAEKSNTAPGISPDKQGQALLGHRGSEKRKIIGVRAIGRKDIRAGIDMGLLHLP